MNVPEVWVGDLPPFSISGAVLAPRPHNNGPQALPTVETMAFVVNNPERCPAEVRWGCCGAQLRLGFPMWSIGGAARGGPKSRKKICHERGGGQAREIDGRAGRRDSPGGWSQASSRAVSKRAHKRGPKKGGYERRSGSVHREMGEHKQASGRRAAHSGRAGGMGGRTMRACVTSGLTVASVPATSASRRCEGALTTWRMGGRAGKRRRATTCRSRLGYHAWGNVLLGCYRRTAPPTCYSRAPRRSRA